MEKSDENTKIDPINEVQLLKTLEHENIIKYIDSFVENDKLIIIMEYADGGH